MTQNAKQYLPVYGGGIMTPGTALMENDNKADTSQVFSPLFAQDFGPNVDILGVSNTGYVYDPVTGKNVARPICILTDLLQFIPNNPGMGLASEAPGDPSEAHWIRSIREHAIPAIKQHRVWTLLPGDLHIDPNSWNLDALTGYHIIMDRLDPADRQRVQKSPTLAAKAVSQEALTVREYFEIFGVVSDKEDFNFIPHCRQNFVRYVPSADALLKWAAKMALVEKEQLGLSRPTPHVFRDHKTGLGMKSPADDFGLGGNNFYPLLKGAYRGVYTDGERYRGQKVAIVGGTALEYSLRSMIAELVDLDFFVIVMLPWCGTMGVDSLVNIGYETVSKYSKKVMLTWDWPDPLFFGPEPVGFKQLAQTMRAQAYMDEFGPKNSKVYQLFQQLLSEHTLIVNRQETPPFALDRLARSLVENNFAGENLYWTMPEIMKYLRAGGVK